MRNYRIDLKQGQTSPPIVVGIAATFIQTVSSTLGRPVSVLDVGCGSGLIMQMIKEQTGCISSCIGIDYSPFVVEALQQKDIYNQAIFSKASVLPFQDKTFDCVLSIECLEHLYSNHVVQSLNELQRVANYIFISTPTIRYVINQGWLNQEIAEAVDDPDPIDFDEFCSLEGAVHKSTVYPGSMLNAGFERDPHSDATSEFYFGKSYLIDTNLIECVGIERHSIDLSKNDYRQDYIELLKNSLQLDERIVK